MSKRWIKSGLADQTIDVFIQDSTSTTGAGLTGLAHNTSGLTCYYRKGATGTPTALTLATQTVGGAHSDGGFVAVDGANMPGVYRLDLSDTIVASAGMVTLFLRGAANMVPLPLEIEVVAADIYDATRLGLTALPNAAAEASGGLITRGTGTGQLTVSSGAVTVGTNNDKTGYSLTQSFPSNFASLAITAGGSVTAGTVSDKTGYSLTQSFPSNFASLAITAGGVVTANTTQLAGQTVTAAAGVTFPTSVASPTNITAGTIATVTNGVTVSTNNDKTGYSLATAPPTAAAIADAVWDETIGDHLTAGSTGSALNAAGSAGDPWTTTLPGSYTGSQAGKILAEILVDTGTTLQGELDGIQADTEDIQSRLPAALVSGRMDASVGAMAANTLTASALATDAVTEIVGGVLTTAMTESYRAAGVAPTLAQTAFELLAHMGDSAISGTTKTLKKIDGTTAKTFTLDSSTAPTSITEAT